MVIKKRGYKQIINLGSGFDIRAYKKMQKTKMAKKIKHLCRVKHFEIDRQHILSEKERIFNENKIDKNAIDIDIDYIEENFTEKLKNKGADLNAPTLIIWEGNWMYLEDEYLTGMLNPAFQ